MARELIIAYGILGALALLFGTLYAIAIATLIVYAIQDRGVLQTVIPCAVALSICGGFIVSLPASRRDQST